ncbi:dATP/dGTP diphosphohydrolase domain-containing protein [Pseudarthrobacter cellobiosi]|uniref:dATP/dGTP diphosphohydrolase domain-containing protein n=1 Tax=Pseudarthrobacter cellobiosi TaxID=2953654 RepID=UPI00208F111A|nr:dATP/dGTP diphosphohydrolase domain-containing protein [Pseudarthrobacter sp. HLT1-5]MCO4257399.1 DUF5664 domain-containing protein [Pseudarthrobacter sp. HLT1-5]
MRVYLAGPMRGIRDFNFPAFDRAAAALREYGHEVFNPAERDRSVGFDATDRTGNEDLALEGFSLRDALAADTEYIAKHADAVALLPRWEKSAGVAAEIALAHALGLPVAKWDDIIVSAGSGTARDIRPEMLIKSDRDPSGTVHATGVYADGEILAEGRVAFAKSLLSDGLITESAARENLAKNGFTPAFTSDSPTVTLSTSEVRTTSATGGEKGTKPERYDLIPVGALAQVAALYGRGAAKYAAHNWRRGYEWSKSYAALQRHATQFWNGEDNDAEMDLPHMASVAFHALALLTFMEEQRGFDDRYTPGTAVPE